MRKFSMLMFGCICEPPTRRVYFLCVFQHNTFFDGGNFSLLEGVEDLCVG